MRSELHVAHGDSDDSKTDSKLLLPGRQQQPAGARLIAGVLLYHLIR